MDSRFSKLLSTIGQKKGMANPSIDDETAKRLEREKQIQMIDDKIAQLEESNDPESVDSINFWKAKKQKLMNM